MTIETLSHLLDILEDRNITEVQSIEEGKTDILVRYYSSGKIKYMLLNSSLKCPDKHNINSFICSICEFQEQCKKEDLL